MLNRADIGIDLFIFLGNGLAVQFMHGRKPGMTMKTWFVTRHHGAIFWAADAGIQVSNHGVVDNLQPDQVVAGDLVVGTLPINIAAEVLQRGARYCHLAMELPAEARGKELSADDMRRYGAKLEYYHIEKLGNVQTCGPRNNDRRTVMLAIASGQSLPNLLPLLALEPPVDHLFLVISGNQGAAISAEKIKAVANEVGVPFTCFDHAPAAPFAEVRSFAESCLTTIRERMSDASIIFNATGGTKIMSSAFTSALGPTGEVIYCDTEHDCIEYFAPHGRPSLPLAPTVTNLHTYLLAQGLEISECLSANPAWINTALSRAELTRHLASMLSGPNPGEAENYIFQLNAMVSHALPKNAGGFAERWNPSALSAVSPEIDRLIGQYGLSRPNASGSKEFSSAAAAKYLGGGWLEEFVALTMMDLGVDSGHWGIGVQIRPINTRTSLSSVNGALNELDLALVWRNRLLIIECKTGIQLAKGKDSQDIINKIGSIRSYAGGAFGASWLLSARLLDKNAPARKRADEYRVALLEREAISVIGLHIARWMQLPMDDTSRAQLAASEVRSVRPVRNSQRYGSRGGKPPNANRT